MSKKSIFRWIIFFSLACGCSSNKITREPEAEFPSPAQLMMHLRDNPSLLIVCPATDTVLLHCIQQVVMQIPENYYFHPLLKTDREVSQSDAEKYSLLLIGTPAQNQILKNYADHLPVQFTAGAFIFSDKKYTGDEDIIRIGLYPNFQNPETAVSILTGNNETAITTFVQKEVSEGVHTFLWYGWGYEIFQNGNRIGIGNFSLNEKSAWQTDDKIHFEFNYDGKEIASSQYFRFIDYQSGITNDAVQNLISCENAEADAIAAFTGIKPAQPVPVNLYPSNEIKAFMTGNIFQSNFDTVTGNIFYAVSPEYAGIRTEIINEGIIHATLGSSSCEALEKGLAVHFTENWQEDGYLYWAQKFYSAGILATPDELLTDAFTSSSPYIMNCSAAVFTDFLIEKYGRKKFLSMYASFNPDTNETKSITQEWNQYLVRHFSKTTASVSHTEQLPDYLQGFNFAHEGYQIYNGYCGSEITSSLKELKDIGTNAIAVIPYAGYRDPNKPQTLDFGKSPGSENDAAVIHAIYQAKQNGFFVMLKPQLFVWNGWTGDIDMHSEEDWKLFFSAYKKWILHYAVIAEIYHADILCTGVDLPVTTVSHPGDWENLFSDVRKIYGGKLTYAANWGNEFESVTFWSKLDYMGINCYYPLSNDTSATDADLQKGFSGNLKKIHSVQEKYDKPLLFTEIGFTSTKYPWIDPCTEHESDVENFTSQERCYQAMFSALQDADWVKGIFIWKWPSYTEFAMENGKDFTPCGKPAEKVIKENFEMREQKPGLSTK